jgi:chromosomal replication initiation ATPase DnaA
MAQLPLDLGHRPALGRADFLGAPCNAEALAWLDRWPNWPATALALHGPPGCGKTHLVHVWLARSGAALIAPNALATERIPVLLGEGRAAAVDDAHLAPPEPLLHLFNVLAERRGHLLIAAPDPPARWSNPLHDLRSRLVASPAAAVAPPDEALLGALLIKLFADRQLAVGEEVIAYLELHLERSFEAALRAVAALDAAALAQRRPVTVPLARSVLGGDF